VVVWDRIVRDKSDAHVKLHEGMNKYGFREVSKSFSCVFDGQKVHDPLTNMTPLLRLQKHQLCNIHTEMECDA
jgi:hypothetical protein